MLNNRIDRVLAVVLICVFTINATPSRYEAREDGLLDV